MTKVPFHHKFAILISLATLVGLTLHETKADTVTAALVGFPTIMATYGGLGAIAAMQGEAHTHIEHSMGSSNQRVHQTSYVPPRYLQHKKHMLQNNTPKGRHPFDNYTLPVVN